MFDLGLKLSHGLGQIILPLAKVLYKFIEFFLKICIFPDRKQDKEDYF